MGCDVSTFTVFFDDPFWVGLYERWEMGSYSVCKLTFGAEPRDHQVYAALLTRWRELQFSPALYQKRAEKGKLNPKRVRREAGKALTGPPAGTKAQEAMKLQQSERKEKRRKQSRQEREAEEKRRFLLRQERKKQKHRGR